MLLECGVGRDRPICSGNLERSSRVANRVVDLLSVGIVDGFGCGLEGGDRLLCCEIWLNDDLGYQVESWVEDWVTKGKTPTLDSGKVAESAQAVEIIGNWLLQAKVNEAIASMWKLDQLGRRHPELKPETESAKQLIGGTSATDSQYLTPTELGDRIGMKSRAVNVALAEAGLQHQLENAKGKKKWDLTEDGKKYGIVFLASGNNNRWSGGQIKWLPTVLDVLSVQKSA